MIRYALKCAEDHRFESWFQSAAAYDSLADRGLVSCPVCGGSDVKKAVMAPRVSVTGDPANENDRPLKASEHPAEQVLRAMREHVEKHSTYVGPRFAAEARAMHLGEREAAAIHGEASREEARALLDEGIPVAPLPFVTRGRRN
jgi:hypothetical protein